VIQPLIRSLQAGLTRNVAFTAPSAEDDRLQGRTYAVPFEAVWRASLELMDGGLRGWTLSESDDGEGIIRGRARGGLRRTESAITLRITLDEDAQTRIDGLSASRVGRADLGANARRLGRFFRSLDRSLEQALGRPIRSVRIEPAAPSGRQAGRGLRTG
jgi:hypothetical protein